MNDKILGRNINKVHLFTFFNYALSLFKSKVNTTHDFNCKTESDKLVTLKT
jgi:hypothetical protein